MKCDFCERRLISKKNILSLMVSELAITVTPKVKSLAILLVVNFGQLMMG